MKDGTKPFHQRQEHCVCVCVCLLRSSVVFSCETHECEQWTHRPLWITEPLVCTYALGPLPLQPMSALGDLTPGSPAQTPADVATTPTPTWTQSPGGQRGQVKDFPSLLASARRCHGPDAALVGVNDFLFVSSWLELQHLQSPHLISAPGNKVIKAATISENGSASTGCPAPDSTPS